MKDQENKVRKEQPKPVEKPLAISLNDLSIRIKSGVSKKYSNEHSFKTALYAVLILKGWL